MNMTVATRPGGAVVKFDPPNLTPATERAVREYLDHEANGNLGRFGVPSLPQHIRDRAAAYVATASAQGAPADFAAVLGWLAPLAGSVAQALSPGDLAARAAVIQFACADLPGWAFNDASRLAAVQKFKWFPSAGRNSGLPRGGNPRTPGHDPSIAGHG